MMFNTRYRYFIIVLLAVYSWLNTLFSEVYKYYGITSSTAVIVFLFVGITFLVWEENRLLYWLLKRYYNKLSTVKFLTILFILSVVVASVSAVVLTSVFIKIFNVPDSIHKISLKLAFTYGTRVNLFLQVLNAIVIIFREYRMKDLETEELRRISAQAQLQVIRNQINPHFLFNNLNVLSGMVIKDNPDANKFIEEFCAVYRHILNSQEKELISLQMETEFITPYIHLLERRFPDSVMVYIDIPEKYLQYYIVSAALQMLVENAIKHNIASVSKPLQIKVYITDKEKLAVENNLQLKSAVESSTHVGLNNIAQRYKLTTGKTIETIKDEFSFLVLLPLIQNPYDNRNN